MAIGVALVGCGMRGTGLIDVIGRCPDLRIAAVCDVEQSRAEAAAKALGVPGTTDHRTLLDSAEIQGVVVATSARFHAPVVMDAIAAGRHVYVEKPLADSPAVARQLAEAAEAAGIVGMVGYQARFTALAAALGAELPAIEPVQALLVRQRGPMNPQYFFPDHYGGIVDTATHTLDMALWTMGGRPEGVMGHIRRGTILGDQTIEYMDVIIDFDDRTRSATVVSSMLGVGIGSVSQFVGRRGTVWTGDGRTLHVARHAGITAAGTQPPPGLERRDMECTGGGDGTLAAFGHFAARIAGAGVAAGPGGCTFGQGADAIAVSAAMVLSAEEGRRVPLAEVQATPRAGG